MRYLFLAVVLAGAGCGECKNSGGDPCAEGGGHSEVDPVLTTMANGQKGCKLLCIKGESREDTGIMASPGTNGCPALDAGTPTP